MQQTLELNGVRTNVLTHGRSPKKIEKLDEPEDLVLLIPGNPGVTGFYGMFLQVLHQQTGLSVWTVGHAGHEIPKNNSLSPLPDLKGHEALYDLQGQIEHKVKFIQEYVPANAKIHFVGHSIGSYIILELLKHKSIESRTKSVTLLFPAIERMAETDNGIFMTRFVKPIIWLILFLSLIYTLLPSFLRNFLMYAYMKVTCLPRMHTRTLLNFIQPDILDRVFFLAWDELKLVKERDNAIISQNIDKIKLIYGHSDGWAPVSYCDRLKQDIPGVDAQVIDCDHAFVLRQSRMVGQLVADRINAETKK